MNLPRNAYCRHLARMTGATFHKARSLPIQEWQKTAVVNISCATWITSLNAHGFTVLKHTVGATPRGAVSTPVNLWTVAH